MEHHVEHHVEQEEVDLVLEVLSAGGSIEKGSALCASFMCKHVFILTILKSNANES